MLGKLQIFSYLLWIAFILVCINFAWPFFGTTLSKQVHTFGLIAQLLGIISVVFLLINKEKLIRYATTLDDTMEQGDIDRGQVIVIVGFAPLKPAEFVIIRIQQKVAQQ